MVTPTGHEIPFGDDANRRLVSRSGTRDPTGSLSIAYDTLGRVTQQVQGGASRVTTGVGGDAVGRGVSNSRTRRPPDRASPAVRAQPNWQ